MKLVRLAASATLALTLLAAPLATEAKLEAGKQDLSLTTITALARALGVLVSELLA